MCEAGVRDAPMREFGRLNAQSGNWSEIRILMTSQLFSQIPLRSWSRWDAAAFILYKCIARLLTSSYYEFALHTHCACSMLLGNMSLYSTRLLPTASNCWSPVTRYPLHTEHVDVIFGSTGASSALRNAQWPRWNQFLISFCGPTPQLLLS